MAINTRGQCVSGVFPDSCSRTLPGYVFIKSRIVEITNLKDFKNSIYGVILNKGTDYVISVCDNNEDNNRLIVTLFDKEDKQIMSSAGANLSLAKHYSQIIFRCNTTDTYYIGYAFQKDNGCGITTLGFRKKRR